MGWGPGAYGTSGSSPPGPLPSPSLPLKWPPPEGWPGGVRGPRRPLSPRLGHHPYVESLRPGRPCLPAAAPPQPPACSSHQQLQAINPLLTPHTSQLVRDQASAGGPPGGGTVEPRWRAEDAVGSCPGGEGPAGPTLRPAVPCSLPAPSGAPCIPPRFPLLSEREQQTGR